MSAAIKAAHTPGPWKTVEDNHVQVGDNSFRVVWAERGSAMDIAYVCPYGEDDGNADARLIAAAPDYFAAVEYWMNRIYDGEPLTDWQSQLLAAHKKAKGAR